MMMIALYHLKTIDARLREWFYDGWNATFLTAFEDMYVFCGRQKESLDS